MGRRPAIPHGSVVPSASNGRVCFGTCEVDLRTGELRKNGLKIKIHGQPLEVLVTLLERPGEVVTREELQQKLWASETVVDFEHGLNKAINKLREALGEDANNPCYIETLPRHGYRFIAPVNPHSQSTIVAAQGFRIRWAVVASLAAIVIFASAGYLYFHRAPKLTDKDTIVLADFSNTTGDTVFDDTLKQGLSVQLEESPFLDLLSDRRVNETLKLMGRPVGDRLTPEVTREVCQRTGSTTIVTGSIAGLGSQYVLGLRAVSCTAGDVL